MALLDRDRILFKKLALNNLGAVDFSCVVFGEVKSVWVWPSAEKVVPPRARKKKPFGTQGRL